MNGKITHFKVHLKVRRKKNGVTKEIRNSRIHEEYSKSLKQPDEYLKNTKKGVGLLTMKQTASANNLLQNFSYFGG